MLKLKTFFFIFLILHTLSQNADTSTQKTETCDGSTETCTMPNNDQEKTEKIKEEQKTANSGEVKSEKIKEKKDEEKPIELKPLIYNDAFLNQPLLVTTNETTTDEASKFFDFRINKKISNFLEEHGMAPYPRERFFGKQQGNFLHFLHLVYEKKLPFFFSVDQILYPYVEITNELQKKIMEKGLYNILHQFLKNVIEFGQKEKFEQGILLYFSIALKFLDRKEKVVHDDVCEKLVKKLLSLEKTDTTTLYNFTLLNNLRRIDKLNFIQIYPILKGSDNLESISDCFRFLQNFEFIIAKELYTIYRVGYLISKSGEEKTYREIKKFIKYIFNEEENVMNPLDIYLYINKNYKNESATNETINSLYPVIKDQIVKNTTFKFMSNYTFINKKEEEAFYKERNSHVSLFSYSFTLDEYINYKLLNITRMRFYPSFFEFTDIAHHGKFMRKIVFDRYKGINSSSSGKLFKYRDGIDVSDAFNYTRKAVKKSMNEEKDKWIDSYENSFNYLLNIVGHTDKKMKKIDDLEIKTYNTLVGGYTHFKKDILLFEQHTNFTYCKNGEIIDIYFDPQKKFYEEIQKVSIVFQNHLLDLISLLNKKDIKIELEQLIEKKMKRLFLSYENVLKGIELQEKRENKDEIKKLKDTMFYYDTRKHKYQGWYVDLYKNQTEKIDYTLKVYIHNFFMARPISRTSKIDFRGVILYTAMNYPEIGLISIEDKENEPKKLFIFSSYTGNEYPHAWTDTINYDGLKKLIITRR
jgi:hypothetical protein